MPSATWRMWIAPRMKSPSDPFVKWPRTEVTELEAQLPAPAKDMEVVESTGKLVPSQLLSLDKDTHRARFLLLASTPSLGYHAYFVRPRQSAQGTASDLKASADTLE